MPKNSTTRLSTITIKLRKALRLESTICDITENIEILEIDSEESPLHETIEAYSIWLDTFLSTAHSNCNYWKTERQHKINSIIYRHSSKRPGNH